VEEPRSGGRLHGARGSRKKQYWRLAKYLRLGQATAISSPLVFEAINITFTPRSIGTSCGRRVLKRTHPVRLRRHVPLDTADTLLGRRVEKSYTQHREAHGVAPCPSGIADYGDLDTHIFHQL